MSSTFHSFSPNSLESDYLYIFNISTGDSRIEFLVELKDAKCDSESDIDKMDPLDLTDLQSAVMKVRLIGSTEIADEVTDSVVYGGPLEGMMLMITGNDFLDGVAGEYEGEIELTFTDGRVLTVEDLVKIVLKEDF